MKCSICLFCSPQHTIVVHAFPRLDAPYSPTPFSPPPHHHLVHFLPPPPPPPPAAAARLRQQRSQACHYSINTALPLQSHHHLGQQLLTVLRTFTGYAGSQMRRVIRLMTSDQVEISSSCGSTRRLSKGHAQCMQGHSTLLSPNGPNQQNALLVQLGWLQKQKKSS